jgi:hypothetical protein
MLAAIALSGCYEERRVGIREIYTRAEVDAINAEIACRNMARSLLQIERCGVRR